ncbi:MAG: Tex family protein [Pseudomonadota bacterium]
MNLIRQQLANELNVQQQQIQSVVELLDSGSTVPFIARYRKEVTGGLDDSQLRQLEQRLVYLRELEDRRKVIIRSIDEQQKLSPELEQKINAAETKTELEDLYLPYKPKRRTKGQIAIEAGLQPLADSLWSNPDQQPEAAADDYIDSDKGFVDNKAVLDGARAILMERFAEQADLLKRLRQYLWQNGHLTASVVKGKEKEGAKFRDYFDFSEALNKIPSHRALALFRGRNEGFLQLALEADPGSEATEGSQAEAIVANYLQFEHQQRAADDWRQQVVQWTWRVKLSLHMETELMAKIRESAEAAAIQVFASNLKDLLMAAPAGAKRTMGLDPGVRTGIKVAVVDETGKTLGTNTVFPFQPQNQVDKAIRTLAGMCKQHKVELISIGNGTHSRETDKLIADMLKQNPEVKATKVMVNEAGASVYSASELAAQEFPDMDVSLRGAVSIARRLQDPLAELVKIEPKSIGVGQYQHDVSQSQLAQSLDAVVEDCVNAVGVDVNMASVPLLQRVSGLSKTLAKNIVAFRDQQGAFKSRKQLLDVPRMGPKAFEQSAGFLRIPSSEQPLDSSAVHPEAYSVVERIAADNQVQLQELIGNHALLTELTPSNYVDDNFGLPTITDILAELDKPGRDPRPEFKTANFKDGVEKVADLKTDMILEGVVTNVANFGAFVDVGVHQDGLVHISALANKFVSDPRDIVKAGDIVKVKVIELDLERNRISLTMKLDDKASGPAQKPKAATKKQQPSRSNGPKRDKKQPANSAMGSALADAFAKAKKD